ncbi:thioredoxin domain-containing protein [Nitratireductor sp. ZSWI3]|uniref:thioredoxin domain-containing protein n=1 Tax=Nitratireductor sp. ZSWI3 TaxID=2966359 RepID=UPI00214FD4FB|nr:thioredoxin domain-containing protein [Nitratireductor sp. ZSWI3]MCR4265662.1 thioredoxin domain-containing protein [Nitratireductor sp. ZSWI3]
MARFNASPYQRPDAVLAAENLLAEETSPYLLQHKDNPVHWRPWSQAALNEARALDRPILLSIGYAACHWCHVMAHESFENEAVAAVMNRLFVNIKVDREERPEIDQIYMAALSATGEQGGWPLTMFLSPDGKPFWGGTYFPPAQRFGRPGFVQVLEAVHAAWRDKRDELSTSAERLHAHVGARLAPAPAEGEDPRLLLKELAGRIHGMIDQEMGGLGGAPKFPNAPFLNVLWLSWLQDGNTAHRDDVLLSLRRMLSGGIYDHVGGGLARYATDAEWLVPHFEKMLCDNAQLLQLLCQAFSATGDALFRIRIEETAGWLLREMRTEGGAFAASLDADTEGEEGRTYLWTEEEIRTHLGDDAGSFFEAYQLASPDNWHGAPILHRLSQPEFLGPAREESLREQLDLLLDVRNLRAQPNRDDKVLVDWNGLTIAALAECGRLLQRPDWIAAAQDAFRFVCESMADGRLPHSVRAGRKLFPAVLSDYGAMISAAIALYQATWHRSLLKQARDWMDAVQTWYGDADLSGFYLTASDAGDVPLRIRGDVDEATPSATSQILEAITALSLLSDDAALSERLPVIVEASLGRARSQAYGQAGIVYAASLASQPLKLVMVEETEASKFVPVANRASDPRRSDLILPVGPGSHTLPGGAVIDTGEAAAYLCIGQTCLPPIKEPAELQRVLGNPVASS